MLFERLQKLETRAMHGQIPVVWDRAEGCQVYDKWGNIWLDFTSTIFVANAGHANNRIIVGLQKLPHAVVDKTTGVEQIEP